MGKKWQEQKALERQKKVYTLTQSQINQIKKDAVAEASDKAFFLMLAIPVMILHDKWWEKTSKKRCPKFIDQCLDLYDSFNRDYVTLEDLKECLWEEGGIKLERSKDPVKHY